MGATRDRTNLKGSTHYMYTYKEAAGQANVYSYTMCTTSEG